VPICDRAMPPLTNCPFCEKPVEIVTLQRSLEDVNICVVIYFHPDGERHFVNYTPKHKGELTYDERPEP
jgi:hypothetical protein